MWERIAQALEQSYRQGYRDARESLGKPRYPALIDGKLDGLRQKEREAVATEVNEDIKREYKMGNHSQ